ncbi:MotA/TolQ/ExbB proton channel family protein [Desulfogranum japonicum]|uniref:MotA/TolQ/ExbB proton channel family protein n=1 Tax=Desulfogranum japonicum TaxID=231447 RepID=UPI000423B807|nr:MotA/TolQ/ExbB proton channel family protein [Desulfogranum japonicum]
MTGQLFLQYHDSLNFFRTGGPIMVPLMLISLAMWALIIERLFHFRRLLQNNQPIDALWTAVCSNRGQAPSLTGLNGLLLDTFLRRRSGHLQLDHYIVDEIVLSLNRSLNSYLAIIGVLAAIAPLLGLLGTVTGMMNTFNVMALFGTGNIKGMASGISEALITTQTGLVIAIPGLYMKSFLDRRAHNARHQVAAAGYYLRNHLKEYKEYDPC